MKKEMTQLFPICLFERMACFAYCVFFPVVKNKSICLALGEVSYRLNFNHRPSSSLKIMRFTGLFRNIQRTLVAKQRQLLVGVESACSVKIQHCVDIGSSHLKFLI